MKRIEELQVRMVEYEEMTSELDEKRARNEDLSKHTEEREGSLASSSYKRVEVEVRIVQYEKMSVNWMKVEPRMNEYLSK